MRRLRLKSRLTPPNKSQKKNRRRRNRQATAAAQNTSLAFSIIADSGCQPLPRRRNRVSLRISCRLYVRNDFNRNRSVRRAHPLATSFALIGRAIPWRGVPAAPYEILAAASSSTLQATPLLPLDPLPASCDCVQAGFSRTVSRRRHVRKPRGCKPSDQRPVSGDSDHKLQQCRCNWPSLSGRL